MAEMIAARAPVAVLYGSQTGCAQEVAEDVARGLARLHLPVRLASLDDFDVAALPDTGLAIFVCSTTGQGETPDPMKRFWSFLLRKSLARDSLADLRYAVFGLGDSSYEQYNVVGKRLFKRLAQLGATPLVERGDGDDQHEYGVEGGLRPWLDKLYAAMLQVAPLPPGVEPKRDDVRPEPRFRVRFCAAPAAGAEPAEDARSPFAAARVVSSERVTAAEHFQHVQHVVLDIAGTGMSYGPGDVAVVRPVQDSALVDRFLEMMGLDGEQWFETTPTSANSPNLGLPQPCRVRDAFERYLGISATPRRYFFQLLAHFCKNEQFRERLEHFCSLEGQDDLVRYNQKERRNVVEVLEDFGVTEVPLEFLLDLVPKLQPRSFSIASSPAMHPNQVHLAVAVVDYRTPYKRRRVGVCSSYLATGVRPGDAVWLYLKPGSFVLPPADVPLVMVGPGTGIAPFRSVVEERHLAAPGAGNTALFFGCRSAQKDWYFADEMKAYAEQGSLAPYATAFSRDQDHKIYVQDRLREHGARVWQLLEEQGGGLLLSGSSRDMPQAVRRAVSEIAVEHGGLSEDEAARWLRELDRQRRYQTETWQ